MGTGKLNTGNLNNGKEIAGKQKTLKELILKESTKSRTALTTEAGVWIHLPPYLNGREIVEPVIKELLREKGIIADWDEISKGTMNLRMSDVGNAQKTHKSRITHIVY